jgi:hypothetical protein
MEKLARTDDLIAIPPHMRTGLVAKTAGEENRSEHRRQKKNASPRGREIRRHRLIG